jgi:lysophospholipase L1-like esterase
VDVYARIKLDIINLKPDYMSILIGINDVWHEHSRQNGVAAPKFERIYNMLIEEIKEALPDIKIMIMEPFVLPGTATVSNEEHPGRWEYFRSECDLRQQVAKRVADSFGLTYVPLQAMFDEACTKAPADYWLEDGVHPTPAGHELIKQKWLEAFERLG